MSNPKKTLVVLIPGFPFSEEDSTCLPAEQSFIRALQELFPSLRIIVLTFEYPFQPSVYRWHGIDVISFGGKNKGGFYKLLLLQRIKKHLEKLRQEANIIAVLSFWFGECAWMGNRFSKRNGLPHFCWIRGQDARIRNRFYRETSLKSSELIAISDFVQDEFEKNHGIRPAHVIPPGIDEKRFPPPANEKDIDIIGVGSLIPLKQYSLFIEVISDIRKHVPGIKVMLIGDGPEKTKLMQFIQQLGLENNISLAGHLKHPETLQWIGRSKILLHPSSYEGFSGVCLEALYAGAHVVSFCKPMQTTMPHWHIVSNKEEMTSTTLQLLQSSPPPAHTAFPYPIEKTVQSFMMLLDPLLQK